MEDLKYLFSFSGFLNEKILNQEKKGGGGRQACSEGTAVSCTSKYSEEGTGSCKGHRPHVCLSLALCPGSDNSLWKITD